MFILIGLIALATLASAQRLVVYDATTLTNTYGLDIASDGTMSQWRISSPGNLLFTPKQDAYLYTIFRCKDYASYNGVEMTVTAPTGAEFFVELQQPNSQCTGRASQVAVSTKEFVTFDGTKKTFVVPFARFAGFNSKNVWALSMQQFNSPAKDHILHAIGFTMVATTTTTTATPAAPVPTPSQWSNYCAYKNGNEHYLAECVKTKLEVDTVYSVNLCPSLSAPTTNNANVWSLQCKRTLAKDSSMGHWHFRAIPGDEFAKLLANGYAYSPQNLGPANKMPVSTTTYKVSTFVETITSTMSGLATLYTTETAKFPQTQTFETTSTFNTTVMVPKTIITTTTLTKIVGSRTVTYVEASETITPWPTTALTSTIYNATTVSDSTSIGIVTKTVPYTTPLISTTTYTDTYGPFYTSA